MISIELLRKAITIILVIVLPLIAYFYLRYTGDTRVTLRRYGPRQIVTAANNPVSETRYHTIPPFSFVAQTGDTVTNKDLDGYIYVADFFFTHCPHICPQLTTQLKRIQDTFIPNKLVKIISHTVDPKRDSVPRMKEYAEKYGADHKNWYFVTGTKQSLYDIARNGYFVTSTKGNGGTHDFIHSERFALVDKKGIIRGYYHGTDPVDVDSLIMDIKFLLWEDKQLKE